MKLFIAGIRVYSQIVMWLNCMFSQNLDEYLSHTTIIIQIKSILQFVRKEESFLQEVFVFCRINNRQLYILLQIHGTSRQKDRIYREDIYYGQGKALADATQTEIQDDIGERRDENPLAYDDNKLVFDLTESDLKKMR